MSHSVEKRGQRLLTIIAGMISGKDAIVSISDRVTSPVTVVFGNHTIVWNPDRAGLLDLCVAARALRSRAEARELEEARKAAQSGEDEFPFSDFDPESAFQEDGEEWLGQSSEEDPKPEAEFQEEFPEETIARWVQEAISSLLSEYPNIGRLEGVFDKDDPQTWPKFSWKKANYDPLDDEETEGDGEWIQTDGLEVDGADDYAWLARKLMAGKYPTEQWPPLEEMPIAELPLKISTGRLPGPKFEQFHEQLRSAENKSLVETLERCYSRSAEGQVPMQYEAARQRMGLQIDPAMLIPSVLTLRQGGSPRAFTKRAHPIEPIFDPEQHLVILGFDVHCVIQGSFSNPSFGWRFLAILCEVHRRLETDFVVVGFADHIMHLPDGSQVYAHLPAVLKDVDDPFDGSFFNRLASITEEPPRLPDAQAASFVPLCLRTMSRMFEERADDQHTTRTMILASNRGMPYSETFDSEAFLSRTAEACEGLLKEMEAATKGYLNADAGFIPDDLRDNAPANGRLKNWF